MGAIQLNGVVFVWTMSSSIFGRETCGLGARIKCKLELQQPILRWKVLCQGRTTCVINNGASWRIRGRTWLWNKFLAGLTSHIWKQLGYCIGSKCWQTMSQNLQSIEIMYHCCFCTQAVKHWLPVCATNVHPLATSRKNEVVITELKDALLDFFAQIGQMRENYLCRHIMVGGDGLTYEKMLLLKKYMQLHGNEFENFKLVEPELKIWHMEETNLSRLFETHWGAPLSQDPSTLGHSARKIGCMAPLNLKKVDYYPSVQLDYLVGDVHMLDCWRLAQSSSSTCLNIDNLPQIRLSSNRLVYILWKPESNQQTTSSWRPWGACLKEAYMSL